MDYGFLRVSENKKNRGKKDEIERIETAAPCPPCATRPRRRRLRHSQCCGTIPALLAPSRSSTLTPRRSWPRATRRVGYHRHHPPPTATTRPLAARRPSPASSPCATSLLAPLSLPIPRFLARWWCYLAAGSSSCGGIMVTSPLLICS